jgi:hypothetical protein
MDGVLVAFTPNKSHFTGTKLPLRSPKQSIFLDPSGINGVTKWLLK